MRSESWIPVIEKAALPEGIIKRVFPKGLSVLLIRKGDEIYALRNQCAHMGCTLAAGQLDGYTLTCPCHEWRFDIRTGEFLDAREIKIPLYEWQLVDKMIQVKIED